MPFQLVATLGFRYAISTWPSFGLGADLEKLISLGADTLTSSGNGPANVLKGGTGNDSLDGDRLYWLTEQRLVAREIGICARRARQRFIGQSDVDVVLY